MALGVIAKSVPPHSLNQALDYVRAGGRLVVGTYTRTTIIDGRALRRFEAAGAWLLKERDDGYQMASGRSSVYLVPGQLKYVIEAS